MKEEIPLISCILPTYNRRSFIKQAIVYFLRQDYPSLELIIIDDGDDPVEDLAPFAENIHYFKLDARYSVGEKRNLACEASKGEYITHWDDDDWIASNRVSSQFSDLILSKAGFSGSGKLLYYAPAKAKSWLYSSTSQNETSLIGGTFLYHRSLWREKPFKNMNIGEDASFLWNLRNKKIRVFNDLSKYIGIIHDENIAPKLTDGNQWEPYPLNQISNLISTDREFYNSIRTGKSISSRQKANRKRAFSNDVGFKSTILTGKNSDKSPKVSCLMPTRNRKDFVRQSICYFNKQSYPNKELIIVDDGDDGDETIRDIIQDVPNISYIFLSKQQSIGTKRNIACEIAKGDLMMCWDDDDWYGKHRISHQVMPFIRNSADATGLSQCVLLSMERQCFWNINPGFQRQLFLQGIIGGSLMFKKKHWQEGVRFPDASIAEDAHIQRELIQRGANIVKLPNNKDFIYVRHTTNTWQFSLGGWEPADIPDYLNDKDLAFYGISRQDKVTS